MRRIGVSAKSDGGRVCQHDDSAINVSRADQRMESMLCSQRVVIWYFCEVEDMPRHGYSFNRPIARCKAASLDTTYFVNPLLTRTTPEYKSRPIFGHVRNLTSHAASGNPSLARLIGVYDEPAAPFSLVRFHYIKSCS